MRRLWLLLGLISFILGVGMPLVVAPANAAQAARTDNASTNAETLCTDQDAGLTFKSNSFTAVSRLPAARVVVFDPVSNSFAFVSSCVSAAETGATDSRKVETIARNLERLDRRRLALTTQKIRLLIMPYNPLNGAITLESTLGTGTEIDETVNQDQTTTTNTPASTSKTGKAAKQTTNGPRASAKDKTKRHAAKVASGGTAVLGTVASNAANGTSPTDTASIESSLTSKAGRKAAKKAAQTPTASKITPEEAAANATIVHLSNNIGKPAFDETYKYTPDSTPSPKGDAQYWAELVFLGAQDFDAQSSMANEDLEPLHNNSDCAAQRVAEMPLAIDRQFRNADFNLAQDTTLAAIVAEANRRRTVLTGAGELYEACSADGIQDADKSKRLDDDIAAFQRDLNVVAKIVNNLKQVANTQSRCLDIAAALPAPKTLYGTQITAGEWNTWINAARADIKDEQTEAQTLQTELQDLSTDVGKLRGAADSFLSAIASPASKIQRFNFVPLRMNQSITFKISRGAVQKADGDKADIPERVNSITLLSAPAYRVRVGAGAVDSWLANPTFKAGEKVGSGANAKTIISADDTGGSVLPAAFVYHHWGYRCPFLESTWQERLLPTFSVGLAADGSKTLQQVLLGLTWPLADGFALNAGLHWGDVNGLEKGLHLGDAVPSTTDVSTLVSKHYTGRAYVGIILNSDTFQGLRGSNK